MMFLKCEGFDYDFEVVIFPKDIEKYAQKLEIAKIIIVNGSLDINFEYNRRSIRARDIKIATINQVREQAIDIGLFDSQRRLGFYNLVVSLPKTVSQETPEEIENPLPKPESEEKFEEALDEKIIENLSENEAKYSVPFVIIIPPHAKKQDLQDLKEFLESQIS